MVHDPVDRCRGGHGALEDLFSLAEHHVAGHDDRTAFVALGDQREGHVGLVGTLLQIAEVVEDQDLEAVELAECTRQIEVALGGEQILDELEGRDEENGPALLDQPVGQRGHLTLSALPGKPLALVVERVTPVATAEDGRNFFRVDARLEQLTPALRPGMEGVAKIEVGERRLIWIWTHSLVDWLRLWIWTWLP